LHSLPGRYRSRNRGITRQTYTQSTLIKSEIILICVALVPRLDNMISAVARGWCSRTRLVYLLVLSLTTLDVAGQKHQIRGQQDGDASRNLIDSLDYEDSRDNDHIFSSFQNIKTDLEYTIFCQDRLLSDTGNDFISQNDFADFLVDSCDVLNDEDLPDFNCPNPSFNTLKTVLQLIFARDMCKEETSKGDESQCLDFLLESENDFGYSLNDLNVGVEESVSTMCCSLLPFLVLADLEHDGESLPSQPVSQCSSN
jgi:hypothetical protein